MAEGAQTGDVKVILKLDTEEAKRKVAEVEKRLRNNERERRFVIERVNKDGFGAKAGGGSMGKTIADKMVEKILPKLGGQNPFNTGIAKNLANLAMPSRQTLPQTPHNAGLTAIGRVASAFNPFPQGGISGENLAKAAPTLALAGALYAAANKASKYLGEGLAYKMKSGEASVKTGAGGFLNELNSTFSYINNFLGSYRDAETRLADWDDSVAAVTGRLPETQVYRPLFQSMAQNERMYQEMIKRNAALTKAGAMGASKLADQLQDAVAHGISR